MSHHYLPTIITIITKIILTINMTNVTVTSPVPATNNMIIHLMICDCHKMQCAVATSTQQRATILYYSII